MSNEFEKQRFTWEKGTQWLFKILEEILRVTSPIFIRKTNSKQNTGSISQLLKHSVLELFQGTDTRSYLSRTPFSRNLSLRTVEQHLCDGIYNSKHQTIDPCLISNCINLRYVASYIDQ